MPLVDHYKRVRDEAVKTGQCPWCDNKVDPNNPGPSFRDHRSVLEWHKTGLCQDCQDEIYGVG